MSIGRRCCNRTTHGDDFLAGMFCTRDPRSRTIDINSDSLNVNAMYFWNTALHFSEDRIAFARQFNSRVSLWLILNERTNNALIYFHRLSVISITGNIESVKSDDFLLNKSLFSIVVKFIKRIWIFVEIERVFGIKLSPIPEHIISIKNLRTLIFRRILQPLFARSQITHYNYNIQKIHTNRKIWKIKKNK